mmetsp:Transcript_39264/g.87881  ORF Transcript_39264/g.87881 Transcript_39264/m.87881 type:complete len:262 (+) Transcript_39264:108-893(+)
MSTAKQMLLQRLSEGAIDAFWAAPDELKEDREVLLAAVSLDGAALACAPDELREDRGLVLMAVTTHGEALEHAALQLAADREVALAAVSSAGVALEFVGPALCSDRDLVMAAVVQDGWALSFASSELQCDREVVLAAIANKPEVLQVAADVILEDVDFATEARLSIYFFRIGILSGSSCIVASDGMQSEGCSHATLVILESCEKLGLQYTGMEALVHGDQVVPLQLDIGDWPGLPQKGAVTEYQLVKLTTKLTSMATCVEP